MNLVIVDRGKNTSIVVDHYKKEINNIDVNKIRPTT